MWTEHQNISISKHVSFQGSNWRKRNFCLTCVNKEKLMTDINTDKLALIWLSFSHECFLCSFQWNDISMKPRAIRNERTVRNFSEAVKGTCSMRPVMGIYKLNILGWRLPNRVTISSRSTDKSYLIYIRAREESLLSPMVHIAIIQRAPTQ